MKREIKRKLFKITVGIAICALLNACSSPEEKAQKYYDKGIELLETDPAKAKLEFQNALQIKKNMVKAVYGLSLAAEKEGDWKAAFGLLNNVLAEQPDHLDANVKVGQMFLAAGNVEKAKDFLQKGKAIDSGAISVKLLDAAIDLKDEKYSSAVAKANQILKFDEKNQQALMVLATERYHKKDFDKAISHIDKAISVDESNIAFKMFKATLLKSKGDYDGTVDVYKSLVSQYPEKVFIRETLAQYYFENKKLSNTEYELRQIIKVSPNKLSSKLNLIKFVASTKGQESARELLEEMVKDAPEDYDLSFYLVDYYEKTNNQSASNELLDKIITAAGSKPEGLQAKVKKAYRLSRKNKRTEATHLVEEVLSEDEGFPKALMLKSSMQLDTGDYDGATLTLRRLLRDQPESVDGLFLMAKVQELMGSTALADESYVQAMAASKDSPKVGIAFAKSLVSRKQNARAKKILSDVLKENPENVETSKYLAQLSILDGDLSKATEIASALKGGPNKSLAKLIDGAVFLSNQDYDSALKAFKEAHKANKKDMQAILAVVNTYYSENKYKPAVKFLKDILANNDVDKYAVRLLLAQVYDKFGDANLAVKEYEIAIKAEPSYIQGYQGLAAVYGKQQQFIKAKEIIQKGLAVAPNSFDLRMLVAELSMLEKNYPEAIKIYRNLKESYPHSLVALNNYVSVVADYENDVAVIEETYELSQKLIQSSSPHFLDSLGWISYRNGKHDEAINYLSQAVKKAPYYAVFQYHLGKSYIAAGNSAKAKKHLEKALQLAENQQFSHTDDIKALLKDL